MLVRYQAALRPEYDVFIFRLYDIVWRYKWQEVNGVWRNIQLYVWEKKFMSHGNAGLSFGKKQTDSFQIRLIILLYCYIMAQLDIYLTGLNF